MAENVANYQPGYPISLDAGSQETQRTAWQKYFNEIERIYRITNENMAYVEQISRKMKEMGDSIERMMSDVDDKLRKMLPIGAILPFAGDKKNIPRGWRICDGSNGTPDLRGRFLEGTGDGAGAYKDPALPNINATFWRIKDAVGGKSQPSTGAIKDSGNAPFASLVDGDSVTIEYAVFDASLSNPIYGREGDTVRPKSYSVYYIMKVSNA